MNKQGGTAGGVCALRRLTRITALEPNIDRTSPNSAEEAFGAEPKNINNSITITIPEMQIYGRRTSPGIFIYLFFFAGF